jgi:hypothetical protein
MIVAMLLAGSLLVPAAADPGTTWPPVGDHAGAALRHMSVQQKKAVISPLEVTANRCIAGHVATDSRFRTASAADVNDLIVESVPSCLTAVRALIDAHDRLFGEGAGETYFMGPFLDALPTAVRDLVKDGQR